MSYGRFAYVYDFLMSDVPYDNWINLFISKKEQYNIAGSKVLDVACGTGEFSVRLAKKGYAVTGVDLSDEMLAIAKVKADQAGVTIPFYQQNMIELDMGEQFDSIVIFCDSLNYLHTENDVQSTFRRVYEQLKPGGLFMFDVHSVFKIEHIFAGQTFADVQDEVSYIWNSFEGEEPFSIEHELTFFVKAEESDQYDRFDEDHYQRTYNIDTYKQWLAEAGFTVKEVLADLEDQTPVEDSERIMFVAVKE
ncbi:class I SAM-dependent methyltransferase [Bacillus sp. AGMB 02131]|uniref:Class I SAM-dependent methyltransferase n=1 Tax=Peribacillus faecalis TaxID=2772559 RepID=A0A927D1R5_9BACI|nr:class I SAM-dependent methyltransferase [Peribacillus faecalis]MBD3109975.1 class I SAM-dependent methyltransferase [Peribacillus faecalis]